MLQCGFIANMKWFRWGIPKEDAKKLFLCSINLLITIEIDSLKNKPLLHHFPF